MRLFWTTTARVNYNTVLVLTVDERISCGQQLSRNDLHTLGSLNFTWNLLFSPEEKNMEYINDRKNVERIYKHTLHAFRSQ